MRTTLNIIGFALLSGAAALPAAAAPDISEVLTMTSSVQYFTHDSPVEGETFDNVNTKELSFEGGNRRLGAQLDTRLGAGGNFFFLHNIYTQGQGFVEMITDLTIAITNNSASTAFLRLDSLITPGFIGFQGQNTDSEVQFLFHVRQFANHPTLGARTDLYQASGSLDHTGPQPNSIVTSDSRQFTGFSSYVSALGDRVAFEWGATPLSLALAPLLGLAGARLERQANTGRSEPIPADTSDGQRTVIIGYGRVGRLVAQMLDMHDQPWLAVDSDPDEVQRLKRAGKAVIYGDARRPELIDKLKLDTAKAVVLTIDDMQMLDLLVRRIRLSHPDLCIVVRARDADHAGQLYALGVTDAVPETVESSLQLAEAVLVDLGVPMGPVIASIHENRDQLRTRIRGSGAAPKRQALRSLRRGVTKPD